MVRIILIWCGRWDLNPHTEVPAPKTGASAIPPLPRIGCRASYSARQRSYSSMEIPGLSNRTREYLSLWMILAPKTVGREQDSRLARRIGQSALKPDGIRSVSYTHLDVYKRQDDTGADSAADGQHPHPVRHGHAAHHPQHGSGGRNVRPRTRHVRCVKETGLLSMDKRNGILPFIRKKTVQVSKRRIARKKDEKQDHSCPPFESCLLYTSRCV